MIYRTRTCWKDGRRIRIGNIFAGGGYFEHKSSVGQFINDTVAGTDIAYFRFQNHVCKHPYYPHVLKIRGFLGSTKLKFIIITERN